MDAEEKKPEPIKKAEEKPEELGWQLPGWVRDVARKLLPVVIIGLVTGGVALYSDNIANKGYIQTNTLRNDQQDSRADRLEARLDRLEAHVANKQREDEEFQSEVLERLRKLLTGKRG